MVFWKNIRSLGAKTPPRRGQRGSWRSRIRRNSSQETAITTWQECGADADRAIHQTATSLCFCTRIVVSGRVCVHDLLAEDADTEGCGCGVRFWLCGAASPAQLGKLVPEVRATTQELSGIHIRQIHSSSAPTSRDSSSNCSPHSKSKFGAGGSGK